MTTIFLIGPRGSGKSTVGRLLAERLGLPFEDTDRLVCERAGCSIAELVEKEGWPTFRALESCCLADASRTARDGLIDPGFEGAPEAAEGGVIATGGGGILAQENRDCMRAAGRVFYLQVPQETLVARLERELSAMDRPSLTGKDPIGEIAAVLTEREPLYLETAHYIIEADALPEQIAREIAGIVIGEELLL